jgi:hypothetical protein
MIFGKSECVFSLHLEKQILQISLDMNIIYEKITGINFKTEDKFD